MSSHSPELAPAALRFFAMLSEAIFTNPFSVERVAVEKLAAEHTRGKPESGGDHHFMALVPLVEEQIGALASAGIRCLGDIQEPARALLKHAFLFQLYHRYIDEFDAFIQAQLARPDPLREVCFADAAMADLQRVGFRAADAAHYFALFYQLRRAYFFIARALVGESACMRELREAMWNNVFTHDVRVYEEVLWPRMEDFSTLLLGETGTGKGSAAAAMGRSSYIPFDTRRRRFKSSFTDTFIATNLSQFPETLIESELFGHRKGAFTGAVENHTGLFEHCREYGTLFLDEIGDVAVAVQLKLLKVLQDRVFSPVGSHQQLRFAGRVIAATNQSLADLRASGRFRDDFYYRLCSDVITVPTLRLRLAQSPQELPALAALLVTRMTGSTRDDLTDNVMDALKRDLPPDYGWPGNVRELEQAIRRILLTEHYSGDRPLQADRAAAIAANLQDGSLSAKELLADYCDLLFRRHGTLEEVSQRVGLDRRTVKKHIQNARSEQPSLLTGPAE